MRLRTRSAAAPRRSRALAAALAALAGVALSSGGAVGQAADLRGVVRDAESGAPVASAQVVFPRLRRSVAADSLGRFAAPGLPSGVHELRIERLGYATLEGSVRLPDDAASERTFELRALPTALDPVTVEAEVVSPRLAQFERRRNQGRGRYLTLAELRRLEGRPLSDAVRRIAPSVFTARGRTGEVYLVNQGGIPAGALRQVRQCYVQVFLDGVRVYGQAQPSASGAGSTVFDINSILVENVAAVEFYSGPASTPPEFRTHTTQCGTVAIWTRDGIAR